VLADLVALSDAGQVQIRMTHVDEGLPVYEVSWRKPGWSLPPHGPDIAAAHHSLGWPVAQVLEMAQPYIEPPDPRDAVVAAAAEWAEGWDATYYADTIDQLCGEVDRLRAENVIVISGLREALGVMDNGEANYEARVTVADLLARLRCDR